MTEVLVGASNGIYRIDPQTRETRLVLERPKRFWPFRKGELGFFGIAWSKHLQRVLVSSRVALGTARVEKKATDTRLWAIDPSSWTSEPVMDLLDLHDVHQIACWGHYVILTDTGKNRAHLVDLETKRTKLILNFGEERRDLNHVNASTVQGDDLLIGLNNKGKKEAEIYRFDLNRLVSLVELEVQAEDYGELSILDDHHHTHDIEFIDGAIYYCTSHSSEVHRLGRPGAALALEGWVRGLVQQGQGFWVGISPVAKRSERHKQAKEAWVSYVTLPDHEEAFRLTLEGAGQVNDLIFLEP